jgi:hypothetical protein|tara:strand:- start:4672 stop:5118 length:447 start_codon:yes stop_codon:yes gene_type:complete
MYTTKELVKDKFWIVEVSSSKIGTIRKQGQVFEFFDQRDKSTTMLDTLNQFKTIERKADVSTECQSLNGYPTNSPIVLPVEHSSLPLFKKAQKGKTTYAAGYYILRYHGMGWQHAYCPKVETLDKYEYQGPYFTEWDMNLQLKKARKE